MSTLNPKVPYHSQRGIPCQSLLVSYPMLHHLRRCPAPGDGAELVSPSASALPLPCRRRNQAWKRPPCHDDPHIMGILRLYWRIMKARMVSCCKSMYNVLEFFLMMYLKNIEIRGSQNSKQLKALPSESITLTIFGRLTPARFLLQSSIQLWISVVSPNSKSKMIHAPFLMVFHSEHVHQPTVNCWLLVASWFLQIRISPKDPTPQQI